VTDADANQETTTEVERVATRSYFALAANRKPIVVLEGSTRSGKTWAILQYLIEQAYASKVRIFAGRDDGTTCEKSIIPDFKEIMADYELWQARCWNSVLKVYTFDNGSTLEFGGTHEPFKLHGRRQDICWLNEAMEISYAAWTQLNQRTTRLRILDFNPSLTHHWVFERILKRSASDYTYCHTTYRDNPFLAHTQIAEIEAYEPTPKNIEAGTADEWHWQVYGLGKRGRREGVVFTLWSVTEDWPDRMNCQRYGYGLDFGFSLDPTAVVECALFQDDLYIRELVYEPGLLVGRNASKPNEPSIQGKLEALGVDKTARMHADSAQAESIRVLEIAGYNVVPTVKTPDSILHGLDLLRRRRLRIHISSQNLQRELENYTWDRRKSDGVWLDHPIDAWNHGIDAARYWALAELRPGMSRPSGPVVAPSVLTQRRHPPRFAPVVAPNPFSRRR